MRVWNKIRAWAGQDGLADEMLAHREMIEERLRSEGMPATEARTRAEREFGPLATAIEGSREGWGFAWAEALWSDARYACRALARDKTFAATAVLTLGVGLALASVAFTLFNAYVLRPFAVRDPDSLYAVHFFSKDNHVSNHPWREFEQLRAKKDVFAEAHASRSVFVSGTDRHWTGTLVSANYFRMLGARARMGRFLEPGDGNVVVLAYDAWQSAFGGDPGVLGKTLTLRGQKFEVIGVAAREFTGLDESPSDFWGPIEKLPVFRAEERELLVEVIARLQEGVTKARAESALAPIVAAIQADLRPALESRATAMNLNPMMLLVFSPIMVALGLVLTTCCANVANMLLARGLARQREIGIRLSVGAGRGRLIRQLLTEALVIAALAGGVGLALSQLALEGGQRLFFATAPIEFTKMVRLFSLQPDYRVFLFALGAAALAAMGAALVPALQATRPNLTAALRGEFGGAFRVSRLRDAMVVLQVVVCTVLLSCGALLYRRAGVFQTQDPGMRMHGVLSIYGAGRPPEFERELRARSDVVAVADVMDAPWHGRLWDTMVIPAGRQTAIPARHNLVSADYFQVMGIGLVAGRLFTDEETRPGGAVAVVSQSMARAFWPGEDPIGKTVRPVELREQFEGVENPPIRGEMRVIGVVKDVLHGGIFEGSDHTCLYVPSGKSRFLLAQVRGDEDAALRRLRQWMTERYPLFEAETLPLSAVRNSTIYPFRAAAWFGWILGLLAMALTVSGMYGVMSYLVNQRSKEIGIRMALGSSPTGVVGLVMKRSVCLAGIGIVLGGGLGAIALRVIVVLSAEVRIVEWDAPALLTGVAIAGVAGVLAALGPSSRAARVDPNTVLRAD
jgi:predicted permease